MPRGSRVRGIVDACVGARLLVMGRDRSFVQRLVSGRTAAGVAERATCPVESVPPDWQDTPRFGAVLVGVRSPVDAVPLLAHAFPVAAGRAARLVVLHAWKLPTGYDDIIASRVALAELETRTIAELEPLMEPWRATYPRSPSRSGSSTTAPSRAGPGVRARRPAHRDAPPAPGGGRIPPRRHGAGSPARRPVHGAGRAVAAR